MFTSRAEYRLLLRQDNADRRLTPLGRRIGLVTDERWQRLERHEQQIAAALALMASKRHQGITLEEWLRRPEIEWDDLCRMSSELAALGIDAVAVNQVTIETKYAGYIRRQSADIERQEKLHLVRIPATFDYQAVPQLRREAKDRLTKVRPANLGHAGRISGITPADLAVLMLYLRRPA
jgi:tRNA uridine 5-carboxymethylaminomethyl modification enzyme